MEVTPDDFDEVLLYVSGGWGLYPRQRGKRNGAIRLQAGRDRRGAHDVFKRSQGRARPLHQQAFRLRNEYRTVPGVVLARWRAHFHHTTATTRFLARNQFAPEMLVVAIGNTDRTRDLSNPATR
jgi:hypothetical protein